MENINVAWMKFIKDPKKYIQLNNEFKKKTGVFDKKKIF